MREEKEHIELLEKERLLTEQEKKCIIDAVEHRDVKLVVVIYCIMLLALAVLCLLFISFGEVKSAIIIFVIVNIGVFLIFRDVWKTTNKLAEAVRKNEVYVREAIYEGSNKYHYASFEIRKNGRRDWFCSNAYLPEIINRGEKVILIQMDEVVVWVYKAREDEMQAD